MIFVSTQHSTQIAARTFSQHPHHQLKCGMQSQSKFWDSNPGPLNSKAKTIPLHKRVQPERAEESPPPLQTHIQLSYTKLQT